jgi:hypothetical protein
VNVGQTSVGWPLLYTLTIVNQGDADLVLDPGSLQFPAGFSLVTAFDQTVAAGGQTQLTLRWEATAAGAFSGEMSFATNDSNENPFNFALTGSVVGPSNSPPVVAPIADITVAEDATDATIASPTTSITAR